MVALAIAISGVLSLIHFPSMIEAFAHLDYPPYFAYLLGVAKVFGVCILLAPRLPAVNEWAYAGIGITLISACVSHFASGEGSETMSIAELADSIVAAISRWSDIQQDDLTVVLCEYSGARDQTVDEASFPYPCIPENSKTSPLHWLEWPSIADSMI